MIAYLEGTVLYQEHDACVLLTSGGVGYQVLLTTKGFLALPGAGSEARLFMHTVVREDALTLYGFFSREERDTFIILLSVPKLGPKTALAMLGCYEPAELATCIGREDVAALTTIPGIGTKTAKRLLLDLKDKLKPTMTVSSGRVAPKATEAGDCAAALISLGYGRQEVEEVVRLLFEKEPDLDASSAIRQALKIFSSQ